MIPELCVVKYQSVTKSDSHCVIKSGCKIRHSKKRRAEMLGNIKKIARCRCVRCEKQKPFACFMFFLEIFMPLLQSHSSLCSFSKNINLHSENSINQQQSNFLKFPLPDNKKRRTTWLAPCERKTKWSYMRINRCLPKSVATDRTARAKNQRHIKVCLS